jgi:glycosyltransferase involved in cell wall biosynthesis
VTKNIISVPCKDEEGNIPILVQDFLSLSEAGDELWLVEGGSKDKTLTVCTFYSAEHDSIHFVSQKGRGKFNAVRTVIEDYC